MAGTPALRLLGIDPGLRHTGWGIVDVAGNRLSHVADGAVHSDDRSEEHTSELQSH